MDGIPGTDDGSGASLHFGHQEGYASSRLFQAFENQLFARLLYFGGGELLKTNKAGGHDSLSKQKVYSVTIM